MWDKEPYFMAVMESVAGKSKIFFLHRQCGCGKTFVCNTILLPLELKEKKKALCVASSGIASLFWEGGKHRSINIAGFLLKSTKHQLANW